MVAKAHSQMEYKVAPLDTKRGHEAVLESQLALLQEEGWEIVHGIQLDPAGSHETRLLVQRAKAAAKD